MISSFDPDKCVKAIISKYNTLSNKGKPQILSNGVEEWTTLSGICFQTPTSTTSDDDDDGLECISLATGVKSMPDKDLGTFNGCVLHDCHAEMLAIRGMNVYIIQQCKLIENGGVSKYIRRAKQSPNVNGNYMFEMIDDVIISMYVSEIPCGDASMELIQTESTDSTIWSEKLTTLGPPGEEGPIRGRAFFNQVGLVRTKPGRRDSPITMSKSCSDKLALKQAISLLLGPVSLIVNPDKFYLSYLILPKLGFKKESFDRCWGPNGRLSILQNNCDYDWNGGYKMKFFNVIRTDIQFQHCKESSRKPIGNSIIWILNESKHEGLISGIKMGFNFKKQKHQKQKLNNGISLTSRFKIIELLNPFLNHFLIINDNSKTYNQLKKLNKNRLKVKDDLYKILKGWIQTSIDDFNIIPIETNLNLKNKSSDHNLNINNATKRIKI